MSPAVLLATARETARVRLTADARDASRRTRAVAGEEGALVLLGPAEARAARRLGWTVMVQLDDGARPVAVRAPDLVVLDPGTEEAFVVVLREALVVPGALRGRGRLKVPRRTRGLVRGRPEDLERAQAEGSEVTVLFPGATRRARVPASHLELPGR